MRVWPGQSHGVKETAKAAEERGIASIREHPRLLLVLALSFLFGFGFLIAVIYFIYAWLKDRRRPRRA